MDHVCRFYYISSIHLLFCLKQICRGVVNAPPLHLWSRGQRGECYASIAERPICSHGLMLGGLDPRVWDSLTLLMYTSYLSNPKVLVRDYNLLFRNIWDIVQSHLKFWKIRKPWICSSPTHQYKASVSGAQFIRSTFVLVLYLFSKINYITPQPFKYFWESKNKVLKSWRASEIQYVHTKFEAWL